MNTTTTAAGQSTFKYDGNLNDGYELYFKKLTVKLPPKLIEAVLKEFSGKCVVGGFSMTEPAKGGIGYFIREFSKENLSRGISPRYGSHIVALLRDQDLVEVSQEGRRVMVNFH